MDYPSSGVTLEPEGAVAQRLLRMVTFHSLYSLEEDRRTVTLNLELAQTVALGPFNPYIINPEWVIKYVVSPADEVRIRLMDVGEGRAFRIGNLEWHVDTRRLMLSGDRVDAACGKLVAKVLELLPHTPVNAVGHNFHYVGNRDEWAATLAPKLGDKSIGDLTEAGDVDQVRWAGIFNRPGVRVEITVALGQETVVVMLNHHRVTGTKDIREAVAACLEFQHDEQVSRELLKLIVNQEVRNA